MRYTLAVLLCGFTVVLAWSAVHPHDYFTWSLEVFPAFLGLAALAITYPRFQFTTFVYVLIFLHACILFVGGHYTYAEVPLFNWIRDHFHFSRGLILGCGAVEFVKWKLVDRELRPSLANILLRFAQVRQLGIRIGTPHDVFVI